MKIKKYIVAGNIADIINNSSINVKREQTKSTSSYDNYLTQSKYHDKKILKS
ncbi:complement inhibitor SCIN family protein [Staphylococcus aureus]